MMKKKKIKNSSILANYILNTIYTVSNIVFPLLTSIYVSRVILPVGVGKVSFAINITTYFLVLSQLGVPRYGPREIAKRRDSESRYSQAFWEIFSINGIATVSMSIAYCITIFAVPQLHNQYSLMLIVGLTIFMNIFNVDWFYTGLEQYKYITIRSLIIKSISLILMFIFVRTEADYIKYALIHSLGVVGNYIFNALHLRRYVSRPNKKLNLAQHFKPILILLSMTIAVELYAQLDTTMIGFLCTDAHVGYYTNPMKLVRMIVVVVTSLSTVLLPRLSWYKENGRLDEINSITNIALKVVIFISFPAFIGITVSAPSLILSLFGTPFTASIRTIKILAWLIPIMSIGNLFGTQILMIYDKERELLCTVILGAIVNIILNSILIVRYQQDGAAFASVVAEFSVMLAQIFFARKYVKIGFEPIFILKVIIGSCFMYLAYLIGSSVSNSPVVRLLTTVISGIFIYFIIQLLLKNEVIQLVIRKIRARHC